MVKIEWDDDKRGVVHVDWHSDAFGDLVETSKRLGLRFDPKRKSWTGSAAKVDEYVSELSTYDSIEIDEYSKRKIQGYVDSITELKVVTNRNDRLRFRFELMSKPPLEDLRCGHDLTQSFQYLDTVFLMNRNRGIANHDCGMGKSYLLTAILEHLRYYGRANKALVFSSNIGIINLKKEMIELGTSMRDEDILVVSSVADVEDRLIFDTVMYPQSIIVISYDTFRHISDHYDKVVHKRKRKVKYQKTAIPMAAWLGKKPGVLFLDECHYLGTPSSLRTTSIDMVKDFFEYRYEMTATFAPVYEKLYSPLNILDPGLVGGLGYYDWLAKYVQLGNKWSRYAIDQDTWDEQALDELNQRLYSRYAIKRKRDEYLDLPPLIHEPVFRIEWTKRHRAIYEAFCNWYSSDVSKSAMNSHKGLVKEFINTFQFAMLSVENPRLLVDSPKWTSFGKPLQDMITKFDFQHDHSKLSMLDQILDDRCGELDQKVIVFYYHPKTKDELEVHLQGWWPRSVSAELSRQERMDQVEAFKIDAKSKVLLCSIKCASTSITVVEAKAIVFFETGWDGIDYDQGSGRIQRPGQTDVTYIYDLRLQDSFDELQFDNLMSKGDTIQRLLSKQSLAADEWRRLFNFTTNS